MRIRVPAELKKAANGRTISVPVGDSVRVVRVRNFIKASLGTSDQREAKRLFPPAHAAVQAFFEGIRNGPISLSHKQILGLAGEMRMAFIEAFDNEPGNPEVWINVRNANEAAKRGRLNPFAIPTGEQKRHDLEARFGKLADSVLNRTGFAGDPNS